MDIQVENHGTILLLQPLTSLGYEWLRDNLDPEAMRFGHSAFVVEPRYVADIVNGAREAGLEVR